MSKSMDHIRNAAGSGVGETSGKIDKRLQDPFRHVPFSYFVKSLTFWNSWPSVLFFTLEAAIVNFLYAQHKWLSVSTTILTVLGTLIGFAISYRTSSAYTQYIEARKAWGNVIHNSRTLSRLIWLHVPNELSAHASHDLATGEEKVRVLIEKKTMINLIRAFSVGLKHQLRGEHGIFYEDLYYLICFLPKYNQAGSNSPLEDSTFVVEVGKPGYPTSEDGHSRSSNLSQALPNQAANSMNPPVKLLPAYNPPPNTICDYFPLLRVFRTLFKGALNATGRRVASDRRYNPEENIPLEILWHLSIYMATLQARKVVDVPTTNMYNAALVGLSDALANIERVLTTPIPYGYYVHLKTIIWGYLAFLPFQLIGTLKNITIPATGLIAFAFIGFLEIGKDIENPFGYGSNDLGLDHFCHAIIAREAEELTSSVSSGDPLDYIFTPSNMPLLERGCFRTGPEILSGLPQELEGLLSQSSKSARRRD